MRVDFPRMAVLVLIFACSGLTTSCALLSPDMTEEDQYANDPVGRAALALRTERNPASVPLNPANATSSERQMAENLFPPRQLTLGMTTAGVQSLWGQPQEIETAGDPTSGNQRWIYDNGLKRDWGTSNYRIVYFEKNQVVGWENHR